MFSKRSRRSMLLSSLAAALAAAACALFVRPGRPDGLGRQNGTLADCPDSPNCVSTLAGLEERRMPPIAFAGDPDDARERLLAILRETPRVEIVVVDRDYVHAEFTSRLLRFDDDVEFLVDREANVIHFRSASRLGYSDLGANRRRMEDVTQRFAASAVEPD